MLNFTVTSIVIFTDGFKNNKKSIKKEGCILKKNKKKQPRKFKKPFYMMGTQAFIRFGSLSRNTPNLCLINKEDEDNFIGRWVFRSFFFNVRFPKNTTRELTDEERDKYRVKIIFN